MKPEKRFQRFALGAAFGFTVQGGRMNQSLDAAATPL